MSWIWENKEWPDYQYDASRFSERVADFHLKAARMYGRIEALPGNYQADALVDLMLSEAIKTSALEGEHLDRDSVRSSLKVFSGFKPGPLSKDHKANGIAAVMVDVRQKWDQPLSRDILCDWQFTLLQDAPYHIGLTGHYRGGRMEIVSGAYGHERVHYEAPPPDQVEAEMSRFIDWYNGTSPITGDGSLSLPGPIKAGVAHVWFENIHPFDDGNGRVGRAIADHALSQSLGYPTMACLATSIEANKKSYYQELDWIGRGNLEVNRWIDFFTAAVNQAQDIAKKEVDFVLGKTRFYDRFHDQLNERQAKAVERVFNEGAKGFEGGLTTKKYCVITKCSPATATRDLTELLGKGIIKQLPGGGRSTHYELATVAPAELPGWGRDKSYHHRGESVTTAVDHTQQLEKVRSETGKNVWKANPRVNYSGVIVKEDDSYVYQQVAENTLVAHEKSVFDNSELLLERNLVIGYSQNIDAADGPGPESGRAVVKEADSDKEEGKRHGR
ncbi:MAG: Fic family protein [Sedimenticola sp.]